MRECPATEVLTRFAVGQHTDTEQAFLTEHLERCPGCQKAVEEALDHACRTAHWREWFLEPQTPIPEPALDSLCRLAASGRQQGKAISTPDPVVPGYEILGELGRGGMGIVYRARQLALGRTVALKVLSGGAQAGDPERFRLLTEATALARFQHPHIVQVYEVGEHLGQLFLALEYCPGGSLETKLSGNALPAREAATLVVSLADAVAAAHRNGVIHRDLKPGNVLLAEDKTVKLTDFGLAKKLDEVGQTVSGAVMGTPSYMAPEQARGELLHIGPLSDVYGLGAILYRLLAGRAPFLAPTVFDTLLQVVHDEPIPPRKLQPTVPRDLETICLKCLEKEPTKRYVSADALADDLKRFLGEQPILARPAGSWERAVKWTKRNPWITRFIALLSFALIGLGALAWQLFVAKGEAETARDNEMIERKKVEVTAYNLTIRDADREWQDGRADKALAGLDRCPPDLRSWEWHFLKRRCGVEESFLGRHMGSIGAIAVTPDGKRVRTAGNEGSVREWDLATKQEIGSPLVLSDQNGRAVLDATASRAAISTKPGEVAIWDINTRKLLRTISLPPGAESRLALSPGGVLLATGDGTALKVRVWDVGTGDLYCEWTADNESDIGPGERKVRVIRSLAFSPDGRRLAAGTRDRITMWDIPSKERMWVSKGYLRSGGGELLGVLSVAFAGPDGSRIVVGGYVDPRVRERAELLVYDTRKADEPPRVLADDLRQYEPLAVSRDGLLVAYAAAGTGQQMVVVREIGTGREVIRIRPTSAVPNLAFAPDGGHLLLTTNLGEVQRWSASQESGAEVIRLSGDRVFGFAAVDDGRTVIFAVGGENSAAAHQLCVWDREANRAIGFLPLGVRGLYPSDLAVSPDGERVALGVADHTVQVWDWRRRKQIAVLTGHTARIGRVAFTPTGDILAGAEDGSVRVWDPDRPGESREIHKLEGKLYGLAISPDGHTIAMGGEGRKIVILHTETGEVIRTIPTEGVVNSVAFDPEGIRLATGTQSPLSLQVWDIHRGTRLAEVAEPHNRTILFTLFTPDGRRIITGSNDGTVKVWSADRCSELLILHGHTAAVNRGVILPNGLLFTSSWDGTVRVWDGRPMR